uniref:Conserved oligomeric Golgi complex subunit 2 n=1 Tax=Trypanosoma vivax (strain Y486) TaxID=1055687 RepID=G0UCV4_TRYVY|nr:conserved hypothetical protein, fragment [Trypanosoma vivax Y486]
MPLLGQVRDDHLASNDAHAAEDTRMALDHLQLVQLCFGEHEFGVPLGDDGLVIGEVGELTKEPKDDTLPDCPSEVLDDKPRARGCGDVDGFLTTFKFDAIEFVRDKLSNGVPLSVLCQDLETYASYLNKNIMDHVNTDVHEAFVKVSGHLVGMQDELRCLQQPLSGAIKKVKDAMTRLDEMEKAVDAQISKATEVELERMFDVSFLKLLLLHGVLCERLDELPAVLRLNDNGRLLNGPQRHHRGLEAQQRSSRSVAVVTCNTHVYEAIRDVTDIVLQIKSLLPLLLPFTVRTEELTEAREMVQSSVTMLHRLLARVFLSLYEEHTRSARGEVQLYMRHVMDLYKRVNEVPEFCRMFREQILCPLLDSTLSWRAAAQVRHSTAETVQLLMTLQQRLHDDVFSFVPLMREVFEPGSLMPVPMIIWPSVCEALVKKMVALYDVSDPDAFQQRYIAAHEILELMKSSCGSSEELQMLLQSPDVALWRHKWNTDVYAAMRVNELTRRVDTAFGEFSSMSYEELSLCIKNRRMAREAEPVDNSCEFNTEFFLKFRGSIDWLFSSAVYIHNVTPKFLRETANSVHRVTRAVLRQCTAAVQGTCPAQEWMCVVMGVIFSADLTALAAYIKGPFQAHLENISRGTLTPSSLSPLLLLLAEDVCHATTVELKRLVQVRVVMAYSHTQKPFLTSPSWFTASIIEPLQHFVDYARPMFIHTELNETLLKIVDEVATRFRVIVKETLVTAKKTEESWEKLRRRKEAAGGGARVPQTESVHESVHSNITAAGALRPTPETASDRDKMTVQLYLDASEFVKGIALLLGGMRQCGPESPNVEELPSISLLLKLLRRANWILGDDIPEPPDVGEVDG